MIPRDASFNKVCLLKCVPEQMKNNLLWQTQDAGLTQYSFWAPYQHSTWYFRHIYLNLRYIRNKIEKKNQSNLVYVYILQLTSLNLKPTCECSPVRATLDWNINSSSYSWSLLRWLSDQNHTYDLFICPLIRNVYEMCICC